MLALNLNTNSLPFLCHFLVFKRYRRIVVLFLRISWNHKIRGWCSKGVFAYDKRFCIACCGSLIEGEASMGWGWAGIWLRRLQNRSLADLLIGKEGLFIGKDTKKIFELKGKRNDLFKIFDGRSFEDFLIGEWQWRSLIKENRLKAF